MFPAKRITYCTIIQNNIYQMFVFLRSYVDVCIFSPFVPTTSSCASKSIYSRNAHWRLGQYKCTHVRTHVYTYICIYIYMTYVHEYVLRTRSPESEGEKIVVGTRRTECTPSVCERGFSVRKIKRYLCGPPARYYNVRERSGRNAMGFSGAEKVLRTVRSNHLNFGMGVRGSSPSVLCICYLFEFFFVSEIVKPNCTHSGSYRCINVSRKQETLDWFLLYSANKRCSSWCPAVNRAKNNCKKISVLIVTLLTKQKKVL